jgi:uncharacterized repeat protein (TIGR01451 family)
MKNAMKIAMALSTALIFSAAHADESGHLKLTTVVQKEEVRMTDSGEPKRELVEATTVIPGDSVVYTITFENISGESAENVTITNPVPANLTYEQGSAFGPGASIQFSVDGGNNYGAPETLKITENGEVRTARPEDYTHIRWVMNDDLAAGAQGVARFRARLN